MTTDLSTKSTVLWAGKFDSDIASTQCAEQPQQRHGAHVWGSQHPSWRWLPAAFQLFQRLISNLANYIHCNFIVQLSGEIQHFPALVRAGHLRQYFLQFCPLLLLLFWLSCGISLFSVKKVSGFVAVARLCYFMPWQHKSFIRFLVLYLQLYNERVAILLVGFSSVNATFSTYC